MAEKETLEQALADTTYQLVQEAIAADISTIEGNIALAQMNIEVVNDDRSGAIHSPMEVGFVAGYILHSVTKQPVFGCTITSNDELHVVARNEDNGSYVVGGKYGSYSLTVTKVGFRAQSKPVTITANALTLLNWELIPG